MITFEPLWETLQEKNISQYTLIKKLVNGHPLSTDILINSVFDGYYLTINFEKFNPSDKDFIPQIRKIRFEWLDHSDWHSQNASSGQILI